MTFRTFFICRRTRRLRGITRNCRRICKATCRKRLQESRNFAAHEYADALMVGDGLPAARRTEIAQKLSRLTGLSADYIERSNLRIEIQRFDKELLRDQRRTVGRLDGRFMGIDADAAGSTSGL